MTEQAKISPELAGPFMQSIQNGMFAAAVDNRFSQMEVQLQTTDGPRSIRIIFIPQLNEPIISNPNPPKTVKPGLGIWSHVDPAVPGSERTVSGVIESKTLNQPTCPNGHRFNSDNQTCLEHNCICPCSICRHGE